MATWGTSGRSPLGHFLSGSVTSLRAGRQSFRIVQKTMYKSYYFIMMNKMQVSIQYLHFVWYQQFGVSCFLLDTQQYLRHSQDGQKSFVSLVFSLNTHKQPGCCVILQSLREPMESKTPRSGTHLVKDDMERLPRSSTPARQTLLVQIEP